VTPKAFPEYPERFFVVLTRLLERNPEVEQRGYVTLTILVSAVELLDNELNVWSSFGDARRVRILRDLFSAWELQY
jgi:hypothetical protein